MKFKHKYIHKFYAFALAAVFALTLAGCGGGGGGTAEPPMTGPTDEEIAAEAAALEAAQNAAKAAYTAAMTAVDGVMADASADPDSYAAARIALTAAKAASDAAAAATTSEAAKAEQAKAEAAQADAEKYAGMVADAKTAADQEEMARQQEAMALDTAQQAAKTAADMAASLLADAEANKAHDIDSYVRAKVASEAAQEALAMANAATTSEAAKAAQADAEAALADVQKYAGMVADAKTAADNLAAEMSAIRVARGAAEVAADAAQAALDAIAGQGDADSVSYAIAMRALEDALAAKVRAENAETAAEAEAAQVAAESALADARRYAGMVADAHMEATALSDAQGAAMQAYMDAKAALAAAEADKDYDIVSYTRAEDAVADAKAASAEAAAATTSADAQAAQAKAEAARNAANGFIGMIATAKQNRENMEQAAEAKAAANKVALSKKAAITTEGNSTTVAARPFDLTTPPSDLTAPTAAENYVVSVKHTGSTVEVEVADGALPADNDPMYEQAATFGNGQMLVRNIGTDRKIIVLHTDIEAPDQVAFSSEYSLTVDRDTDTTANDTYAVLAADNGKIASPSFPNAANQSQTYVLYDADTATGRASQFSGTFDGASGTFRCVAASGCTVATDAMGKFTALTPGEWEFTPAAGATVAKPDGDYLTYGFWLDTKTKDGNVSEYEVVQTFATSSLTPSTGLTNVTGTATYEGGAAGVYVHETKKEDGTLDTATSGRFTADVAMTAYFTTTNPTKVAGSLEGTISNFDLDGGPANSWNVNVSAASITNGTFTGNASGMSDDNGSMGGTFHGTGDADDATVAPPVLVGEFNANFVNGTAAGAFGARKQ